VSEVREVKARGGRGGVLQARPRSVSLRNVELLTEVARTTLKPIARFKVRKPEPRRHPDRTP